MRFFIFFMLLNLPLLGHTQIRESAYHCQRDTVISQKSYGSVYITRDHQCNLYEWLFPDPRSWSNEYGIQTNFPDLARFYWPKESVGAIPRYWNDLYTYHGHYYVYGPSDWMSNRPIYIADSFLIEIASDFSYFKIEKTELVHASELLLHIDLHGEHATLRIRLLDFPKGAALWEYTTKDKSWSELKVSIGYARNYDLINNDCVNTKCFQEFEFDTTDLSHLKFMD
jgi:hypothetical protein